MSNFIAVDLPLGIFGVGLGAVGGWGAVFIMTWVFQVPWSVEKMRSLTSILVFGSLTFSPVLALWIFSYSDNVGAVIALIALNMMAMCVLAFIWLSAHYVRQELRRLGVLTVEVERAARGSSIAGCGTMLVSVLWRFLVG